MGRARNNIARGIGLQIAVVVATLAACELGLRAIDLRYLRESALLTQAGGPGSREILLFRHDAELGWSPIPNSTATYTGSRTISTSHNSLSLRDIEFEPGGRPTILFLGDSFVWGYDVEAQERFTDILRRQLPAFDIVNAGVSGYGTDQQLLLLRRLWDAVRPDVVVLTYCAENDRQDNSSNLRYDDHYKPYFVAAEGGGLELRGQPVPQSRHVYFTHDRLANRSWLARLAISAYLPLRHPRIAASDPTERLIQEMRQLVEGRGATFLVGLQGRDAAMERFLQAGAISHVAFADVPTYPSHGNHWTPEGHEIVARRLMALLRDAELVASRERP